ncbi:sodium/proline symporter [Alkalibacillus salilacus]|uniref:Sodium/proline symporter n=1 Tax=Alkalibacillus salilacus TaxID=284582 RepID=A0ABT9VHM2_9BACI|nr:sodium/proline symporter [Alkalibacillus salilacus]MDQ0160456.1 sodium/proline symporter [Alkalibacillus salilacus]
MDWMIILPIIVYIFILVGIGAYSYKFTGTREGFHLGGRKIGSWVTAISYAFSGMSAFVLIGFVGMVYTLGPSSFYTLIGYNIGFAFSYIVIAKRLRNYSEILDAYTYTDYFVKRVRGNPHMIRAISAISILVFMSVYVGSQLAAGGMTIETVFDINPTTSVIIAGIVVTAYCLFGGFAGVSITDYFQGIIVVIGTAILGVFMINYAGGWSAVVEEVRNQDPALVTGGLGASGSALLGLIFGYLTLGVAIIGRPHDTIRFFAISSSSEVRKSFAITLTALTITYWGAFLVGYAGRVIYPNIDNPEYIFPFALVDLTHPIFGGFMIAVFLGLLMSTSDSQLLSSGSTFGEDVYRKYINMHASDRQILIVTRLFIAIVGILSTVVAVTSSESIFWITVYASAGLAATFAPVLVFSLYWDKLTNAGAVAGMLTGFMTVVLWDNFMPEFSFIMTEAVPAVVLSSVVIYVVSKLTEQPELQTVRNELQQVKKVWKK